MYDKEMKHYKDDLEFQWVYQGLEYIRLKSTYEPFIPGINA